ncbi:hypothetical protein PX554_13860 [Sphingomonas sp. H39-1-10]|uniref:hypothetical protein n=1 Tax=Sphingomonas pollutisoli TaxID=3030829 RepID=UPI0023B90AB0|nr:hypothetical protein [Sphingomonas pollutisoli]MDF0489222.1 hypothetical protein [Sphingomonas pollutisoli]
MIATLALRLLGRAAPAWLSKPVAIVLDVATAAVVVAGVYCWIYSRGEADGAAKIATKVTAAHSAAVADARHDERAAQAAAGAIGAAAARTNQDATAFAQSKIEDMHHAIDVLPDAPAGAAPARVDSRRLSASLDALIDRANRAADAADAQR